MVYQMIIITILDTFIICQQWCPIYDNYLSKQKRRFFSVFIFVSVRGVIEAGCIQTYFEIPFWFRDRIKVIEWMTLSIIQKFI